MSTINHVRAGHPRTPTPRPLDRAAGRSGGDAGPRIAALTAAGMYGTWAALQLSLAAGAPLGQHVWGGNQEATLSPGMRIASGGAALVLIWMLSVVLARADLAGIKPVPTGRLRGFTWAIAGYLALNTIGNLASQSTIEQRIFAPMTALMAALTAVVAHRGRRR